MKESDYRPTYMSKFAEANSNIWWYKIPDNPYTGKKPFDVFGYYANALTKLSFAFEFKIHTSIDVWSCARVIPYQEESLKAISQLGVDAQIILGIRCMLSFEEQKKLAYPIRRVSIDVTWPVNSFLEFRSKQATLNVRDMLKAGVTGHVDGRSL
jgi:hypothetical protein